MRGNRLTYYVCSGIKNNNLVSKNIEAGTETDAANSFEEVFGVRPQTIYGPFFKKKNYAKNDIQEIKFSSESISAIYNGWKVKAIILQSPENHALLFFQERVDGKKVSKPKGTHIIQIGELDR